MMRKLGVAGLVGLLALASFASGALAQCGSGLLIKFDSDAFAYETSYNPATFISAPGSQMTTVGIASFFCAPLNGLDPTDPLKEYTFVFSGLTSAGTVGPTAVGTSTRWQTSYGNGQFYIYEGSPRNAPTAAGGMPVNPPNATVPANFADGTLILQGTLSNFITTITRASSGTFATSFRADYQFTGPAAGPVYVLVSGTGPGLLSGLWCANSTAPGLCDIPVGYSAHPNGKFDQPAVAAINSTWGKIKTLYR